MSKSADYHFTGALAVSFIVNATSEAEARSYALAMLNGAEVEMGFGNGEQPRDVIVSPDGLPKLDAPTFPRLVEVARRAYWEVAPGVYQATGGANVKPSGTAGYRNLEALKKIKGDAR